jgi:hypothetical protein
MPVFCRKLERRVLGVLVFASSMLGAQPTTSGAIQPIASLRLRAESWDWFDAGPEGRYELGHALARAGATQRSGAWQWRVEAVASVMLGLPSDAVRPAPAGQLGLGGTYYAANDQKTTVAAVFVRQAWLRWARNGHAVRAGRFEFGDGMERAPRDATLSALKAQRMGQRLIGPFGFSAVQRAFDGAHYSIDRGAGNFTALAVRPTAGAFRAEAQEGLRVDLAYAAYSRGRVRAATEMDVRFFGMWYADHRGTIPTDNRALAARQGDRNDIRVATIGGHWLATRRVGRATIDGLAWGALQGGDWGSQDHGAGAVAIEGGLQHAALPWSMWLRGGWLRTSGDANAADRRHGTFFQVLPTARVYARFPFYNLMNSSDLFVNGSVKPTKAVGMRGGVHAIALTEATDLWYLGGGAFDDRAFGYVGRPSNARKSLAHVADLSVSWQATPHIAVELYGAAALGGKVVSRIYDGSRYARLLFLETTLTR